MFRALDNLIIDRLDRLTLRLQKRGLNLVQLHVHVVGFCLLAHVGTAVTPKVAVGLLIFNGLIWGFIFLSINLWAAANKDYRENIRKTERLNSGVLETRERVGSFFFRMMAVYLSLIAWMFIAIDIWFGDIMVAQMIFRGLATPTMALMFYLDTCVYLAGTPARQEAPAEAATEGSQA